ncbi:MAG: glycerol kinase GlpK [Acidimicrobiales bacterium]|nr:glycerol kinase GlpK [Acidimicrobiales bacterium]
MQVVLALDAGTTSVRTLAVGSSGEIIAISQKEFSQIYPEPGLIEHDPEEIWQAAAKTLKEVSQQVEQMGYEVASIGITNQRETAIIWDHASGKPLHNAIVWQDRRTTERCQELTREGHLNEIRSKTGLVLDPYFSASKFEWMIKSSSVNSDKKFCLGTVDSWLIWKLTNGEVHATEPSNASRSMLFDLKEGKWSNSLCDIFSIPVDSLPEIRATSGYFGSTSTEGPLGKKIPIRSAIGDQQSSLFGQVCFKPGDTKNTYGTGSFILTNIGEETPQINDGLITTVAWQLNSESPLTYAVEGSIFSTGATVQWLRDQLEIIKESSELEQLAKTCTSNGGVIIVPAFSGLGSPWWNPSARGVIVGLTRGVGKAELARATIESMAFQTRDVLEAIKKNASLTPESLKVDGGAAVMDLLMQFQADQLKIPVIRSSNTESTAMGAAYLAGLASGIWESLEEIQTLWKGDEPFLPDFNNSLTEELYKNWLDAVKRSIN